MATQRRLIEGVEVTDRGVHVVRLMRVFDASSVHEFEKVLTYLLTRNHDRIVVDLTNVEFISSAGWGAFTGELRRLRDSGGDIRLAGMNPDVLDVFLLLELDSFISAYNTVEEAIWSFDTSPVEEDETTPSMGTLIQQGHAVRAPSEKLTIALPEQDSFEENYDERTPSLMQKQQTELDESDTSSFYNAEDDEVEWTLEPEEAEVQQEDVTAAPVEDELNEEPWGQAENGAESGLESEYTEPPQMSGPFEQEEETTEAEEETIEIQPEDDDSADATAAEPEPASPPDTRVTGATVLQRFIRNVIEREAQPRNTPQYFPPLHDESEVQDLSESNEVHLDDTGEWVRREAFEEHAIEPETEDRQEEPRPQARKLAAPAPSEPPPAVNEFAVNDISATEDDSEESGVDTSLEEFELQDIRDPWILDEIDTLPEEDEMDEIGWRQDEEPDAPRIPSSDKSNAHARSKSHEPFRSTPRLSDPRLKGKNGPDDGEALIKNFGTGTSPAAFLVGFETSLVPAIHTDTLIDEEPFQPETDTIDCHREISLAGLRGGRAHGRWPVAEEVAALPKRICRDASAPKLQWNGDRGSLLRFILSHHPNYGPSLICKFLELRVEPPISVSRSTVYRWLREEGLRTRNQRRNFKGNSEEK